MNIRTKALTTEQYKEIITTMKSGFCGCRPNERIATALVLEGNLGLRVSDILRLRPCDIVRDGDRYYLIGYDDSVREIRTYRIDRMENVHLCDEPREGENLFESLNIESYVRRVFGMYGGETKRVTIRFVNKLLDTAVDRFGSDGSAHYLSNGDNHFTVSAEVDISRQFFGWICGFETDATIISPPEVVEQMKQFVDSIANCYRS